MIERRLKPRGEHSLPEVRQELVTRFNASLGPPDKADQGIQHAFLKGTMPPGERQQYVSMCEYVIGVVDRNSDRNTRDD